MKNQFLDTVATPEFMQLAPGASNYAPEQIDAALMYIASQARTPAQASRDLGVHRDTLKSWTRRHSERLQELKERYGPDLEKRAVTGLQGFVVASEEVKQALLDQVMEDIERGEIKDPAKALQSVSVAQGISVQKILELTGRPTSVIHHQSLNQIMAQLRSLGADVQGTAEPLIDSQGEIPAHASSTTDGLTTEADSTWPLEQSPSQPSAEISPTETSDSESVT